MSRIGNSPVHVPQAVTLETADSRVTVRGPKGELVVRVPEGITLDRKDDTVVIVIKSESRDTGALQGVTRANLANAVTGVTDGWSKKLELVGVGYRASLAGVNLQLNVGFSHPVVMVPPPGITFQIAEGKVVVSGIDKHLVGETSAKIREVRKPEPYKGKGIRYQGEYVRKKAGKAAKAIGGAPGS